MLLVLIGGHVIVGVHVTRWIVATNRVVFQKSSYDLICNKEKQFHNRYLKWTLGMACSLMGVQMPSNRYDLLPVITLLTLLWFYSPCRFTDWLTNKIVWRHQAFLTYMLDRSLLHNFELLRTYIRGLIRVLRLLTLIQYFEVVLCR